MIVPFDERVPADVIDNTINRIIEYLASERGIKVEAKPVQGVERTVVGFAGKTDRISSTDIATIKGFPGVYDVIPVKKPHKLVSRRYGEYNGQGNKRIMVGNVEIGGDKLVVAAGPCSIQSYDQLLELTRGAQASIRKLEGTPYEGTITLVMRGGADKPRTNAFTDQGLGEEGHKILSAVRDETGVPYVTELMITTEYPEDYGETRRTIDHIDLFNRYNVDMVQIGMRSARVTKLIEAAATAIGKPLLLKNNDSGSVSEWLQIGDYAARRGDYDIVFCQRGVTPQSRSSARNHVDLDALVELHEETYMPIALDPSHQGRGKVVIPVATAGVMLGIHMLLVETTRGQRDAGFSDYSQSLNPKQFDAFVQHVARAFYERRQALMTLETASTR